MPVRPLRTIDEPIDDDDYVYRMNKANQERNDAKPVWRFAKIEAEDGPVDEKTGKRKMTAINLRYEVDSPFLFAVWRENPTFVGRQLSDWASVAADALFRHAAENGRLVKDGPREEPMNRYNQGVELDAPLERSEAALAAEVKEKTDADKLQEMQEQLTALTTKIAEMSKP